MNNRWHPHIAIEEANITMHNLAGQMEPDDHAMLLQQTAEANMKNTGPDFLVLPFLLFNMDPEWRTVFAGELPPVISEQLVPVVWKEQWAPMKPFLLD